ncbi:hypothetical protein B0H14DRAFT_2666781 [Mycena olivaceomarginata]|nr:hypothetical protein B0H14DRAFT_2666781 [Mycena olivaceomarginata]
MSTVLFLLNRYLPFVDTFLGLSCKPAFRNTHALGLTISTAKFTRLSAEQCLTRNITLGWLSVFGILLSEGILMLRTYAIWERKRSVLIFLCALAVVVSVPAIVFVYIETHSLHYKPSSPDVIGCTLAHAGSILIFAYVLIMISETAIAVLTAIKAYRDLRRSRVPWILKLYKDGMLFYVYLLIISLANVVVPILAPSMFANWLATPQRVLHSVLCSRVLLLILRRRKIVSVEVQRSSMSESEATGMIFSSVVDDTTMGSIGVDTVSSSSRRVYAYPMSPGADDEEGRSRFNWL